MQVGNKLQNRKAGCEMSLHSRYFSIYFVFFSSNLSLKCLLCDIYSISLIFSSQVNVAQPLWKGAQKCLLHECNFLLRLRQVIGSQSSPCSGRMRHRTTAAITDPGILKYYFNSDCCCFQLLHSFTALAEPCLKSICL
jgi:hypothetical protein